MTNQMIQRDRGVAIEIARELLRQDLYILDTETTGLGSDAEICEIAVIDKDNSVVLNTLVKPSSPIPADAIAIHGITNEDVADAPSIEAALGDFKQLTQPKSQITVGVYNLEYDLRLLAQSLGRAPETSGVRRWDCIMKLYAQYFGAWNDYRSSYTWQSLANASLQCGMQWRSKAHRALGDCRMTLDVLKYMARQG